MGTSNLFYCVVLTMEMNGVNEHGYKIKGPTEMHYTVIPMGTSKVNSSPIFCQLIIHLNDDTTTVWWKRLSIILFMTLIIDCYTQLNKINRLGVCFLSLSFTIHRCCPAFYLHLSSLFYYRNNVSTIPCLTKFRVYTPMANDYKLKVLPYQLYKLLTDIWQTHTTKKFSQYHSSMTRIRKYSHTTNKQHNVT